MSKISRLIVWICKKFNREQIERIIQELLEALKVPNSEINSKDRFKEEHPHYRSFYVDSKELFTEKPDTKKNEKLQDNS
jgi:hypothetical protein